MRQTRSAQGANIVTEPSDKDPLFETWVYGGVRFLATQIGGCYIIVDQQGNSYGSWDSIEHFRVTQQKRRGHAIPLSGVKVYKFGFYITET